MKKLILIIAISLAISGCEKKNNAGILDPTTQITLNGITSKVVPSEAPYSLDTIVRYAGLWGFRTQVDAGPLEGGISKEDRDFANKKLKIGIAEQVVFIDKQGDPQLGYLMTAGLYDIVLKVAYLKAKPNEWDDIMADNSGIFTNQNRDTIGYIPNAVVRKAEADITAAFDKGDYDECMRLFREAYVFIPTTGPEWRAMKARGEN